LCGLVVVAVIITVSVSAGLLATKDPLKPNLGHRLVPPWSSKGGILYTLGTDQLGRDILARLLYGGRVSLLVGATTVLIAGTIGVLLGLFAGFFAGQFDAVIMRLADVQLGFPIVLLAILLTAIFGPGMWKLVIIMAAGSWVVYARTVRGMVLSLREHEFVEAARALGGGDARLLTRHILPNLVAPVMVIATIQVGQVILLESALSFLGLGVQPPTPSWGVMISEGRGYIHSAWWLVTVPGMLLALLVISMNMVGDGLRDVVEPEG
jgi:peptide/nickel transport system permease protein